MTNLYFMDRLYLDGKLAKFYPNFNLITENMKISGQLVLGNSPTGKQPWNGNIFGLAIYDRFLKEEEVFQNYQNWLKNGSPTVSENEGLAALYLFDEHYRTVVQNHAGQQYHLLIPATFQILQKIILIQPWEDFRLNLSYLSDILINIMGFIPLGFFFSTFLYNVKQLSRYRIYLITVFLGGGMSLSIELLQVYLVTRSSQMTDSICNTLGTVVGVFLFQRILMFFSPLAN
jgi:VanZ family protein